MTERQSILEVTGPALVTVFILAMAMNGIGAVFPADRAEVITWSSLAWELPRTLVIGWAGWLVCSRGGRGIIWAGVGGVLVFFVAHPIATSLTFLFMALGDSANTLMAIAGVMISFLMFAPIAFVVGVVGGTAAKLSGKRHAPDT